MVIVGIEEDKMAGEVRVHELKGEGCSQSCKERSPHHFVGEVVGDLVRVTCNGETVRYTTLKVVSHNFSCFPLPYTLPSLSFPLLLSPSIPSLLPLSLSPPLN